nr:PREDICTED: uncharacterized protein LOC105662544 [Megachile rotundata]
MQTSVHPKKDATAERKVFHRGGEEKPSTSKEQGQLETLSIDSIDKSNERRKREISMKEAELRWIRLQTLHDLNFDRSCDPERFKIDNTFSDFSLQHVGHDNATKKRISEWMIKYKERSSLQSNSIADNRNTDKADETHKKMFKGKGRNQ